LTRFAL